jgi:uncharacterized YceG family protein
MARRRDSQPRSAADREAARLERERRRAEREGRAPAAPAPEGGGDRRDGVARGGLFDEAPPAAQEPSEPEPRPSDPDPEPPAPEPEPETQPEREPATEVQPEPGPEPEVEPEPESTPTAREPDPEPEPAPDAVPAAWSEPTGGDEVDPRAGAWQGRSASPAPEPASAPAPADGNLQATEPFEALGTASRRTVSLPRPQTDLDHTDGYDAPIGTVRVGPAGGYQTQPGASGYPPYRQLGVTKPRRRWARRFGALLALALVIGVAVFAYLLYQPAHGPGHGQVQVAIPAGAGAAQIGDLLAQRKVVDSGFFFSLRARLSGQRGDLRSGRYSLREGMPYSAALTALTTAPKAAPVINVTIPEGPSRREAAARVRDAGVRGDYLAATRRSSRLRPRDYGAPRGTSSLEGFLYPATYELRRTQATAPQLVARQLAAFEENFAKVNMREARRKNLSRYDVLVIASMIERESGVPRDRRLISAVIYNRLREGMPLGIDATIRYALNNWSRPLRVSELARDTPYNTRKRKGLPPTPIGNPGLPAIRAAANPANVDYLFYVVRPCGNGAHAFSSTDAEFQRDVAAYNRARDRRGGKDPSRC